MKLNKELPDIESEEFNEWLFNLSLNEPRMLILTEEELYFEVFLPEILKKIKK